MNVSGQTLFSGSSSSKKPTTSSGKTYNYKPVTSSMKKNSWSKDVVKAAGAYYAIKKAKKFRPKLWVRNCSELVFSKFRLATDSMAMICIVTIGH